MESGYREEQRILKIMESHSVVASLNGYRLRDASGQPYGRGNVANLVSGPAIYQSNDKSLLI